MKKKKSILLWGALAACAGGVLCFRRSIRMPLKEYTRYALLMAVLDDEICRNELQGPAATSCRAAASAGTPSSFRPSRNLCNTGIISFCR